MQSFGASYGYTFSTVVFGVDKKSGLPSGSATVHVDLEESDSSDPNKSATEDGETKLYDDDLVDDPVARCIETLQGEDCGGRPLRVQRFLVRKRQSGSLGGRGDSRYFADDISCKCHNCGEVGHRQQDCTNDTMPVPCHLCAGLDHDAGKTASVFMKFSTYTYNIITICMNITLT